MGTFYQNMTPVEFAALNMPPIDEDARRVQAQELLGGYYGGSFAARFEENSDLNYLIYKKLEKSMAPRWKTWLPQVTAELIKACQKRDMDPIFVLAIIETESRFDVYAKGTSGEIGLMQILPKTGEWIAGKYEIPWQGANSLYDPITNIQLGIAYFAHLRKKFESRPHHYVPAYNMGPGNLRRVARTLASAGEDERSLLYGIYGSKVMKNYQMIYQQINQMDLERPRMVEQKVPGDRLARGLSSEEKPLPQYR